MRVLQGPEPRTAGAGVHADTRLSDAARPPEGAGQGSLPVGEAEQRSSGQGGLGMGEQAEPWSNTRPGFYCHQSSGDSMRPQSWGGPEHVSHLVSRSKAKPEPGFLTLSPTSTHIPPNRFRARGNSQV